MFHRFISLGLAFAIGLALAATAADAHHRKKLQPRPLCKGFIDCLLNSKKRSSGPVVRTVNWRDAKKYPAGTVVVQTRERALYYVVSSAKAIRYPVGVGRQGFQWSGNARITRKAEWPSWTPPDSMIQREARNGRLLPSYIPGGPNNPLGARALYIGTSLYRIHGTNDPSTIGQAMSSGCIRMMNAHVEDLYRRVR
ncbi:MAG: L,D-transpeptidase, partial [Aestuariivirgaceae bacterium]